MSKKTIAILVILTFFFPFLLWNLVNCAEGYIPPSEPYQKTPDQFEAAFNEQMAKYGMYIDIDSVNFTYGDSLYKVVPVICEDGSKITCTYYPTSERRKALLEYISFEQELTGQPSDRVYIAKILEFMLDEFVTGMTVNKDETFEPDTSVSYNEAIKTCEDYIEGRKTKLYIRIANKSNDEKIVTLERGTGDIPLISVSMYLWS
jgi:hypothetical protein